MCKPLGQSVILWRIKRLGIVLECGSGVWGRVADQNEPPNELPFLDLTVLKKRIIRYQYNKRIVKIVMKITRWAGGFRLAIGEWESEQIYYSYLNGGSSSNLEVTSKFDLSGYAGMRRKHTLAWGPGHRIL